MATIKAVSEPESDPVAIKPMDNTRSLGSGSSIESSASGDSAARIAAATSTISSVADDASAIAAVSSTDVDHASSGEGGATTAPPPPPPPPAPGAGRRVVAGYILSRTLGEGAQGKVKLGIHEETGEIVALKIVPKRLASEGSRALRNVKLEVDALRKALGHDNVVGLKAVHWDVLYPKRDGSTQESIVLVLDFAAGGELIEFMLVCGGFPEDIARGYFQQLINALDHCHSLGYAHRDLKPENLLLSDTYDLKVADFGMATLGLTTDGRRRLMWTKCGTEGYMAPELSPGSKRPVPKAYDPFAVDVWSAGVILFVLLAGFPPFNVACASKDWWYYHIAIKNLNVFWAAHERTVTFSKEVKDLLNSMFEPNPSKRATIKDILKHPWFTKNVNFAALRGDLQRRAAKVKHAKAHKEDKAAAAAAGGGDGAGGGADNAATGAAANNAATGTAAAAAATAGAGAGAVAAAVAALDDTGTGTDSSGGAGAGGGAGASSAIGETAGLSGAGGGAGVVARTSDDTVYTGVLSADFDPTTFDTTRAVHVSKEPAVAPSQLRWTTFCTRLEPQAFVDRLAQALSRSMARFRVVDKGPATPIYRVKSHVLSTSGHVLKFVTEVFKHPDHDGLYVVEVARRSGGILQFQKVFDKLKTDLGDVIVGDDGKTPLVANNDATFDITTMF